MQKEPRGESLWQTADKTLSIHMNVKSCLRVWAKNHSTIYVEQNWPYFLARHFGHIHPFWYIRNWLNTMLSNWQILLNKMLSNWLVEKTFSCLCFRMGVSIFWLSVFPRTGRSSLVPGFLTISSYRTKLCDDIERKRRKKSTGLVLLR